jgi:integrase
MASLTKKPTSENWFACFRDRTGKQHRVSTHETRKSVAQKIADKYELVATRKTSRRELWDTLNQLQSLISGEDTPHAMTVSEFCELWVANRKVDGVAPATEVIYKNTVKRFLVFLGPTRAGGSLVDISKRDIEKFRNELVQNGLARRTVNRDVTVLRMIFKEARIDGCIFENPAEGVRAIKGETSSTRRPFTLEEIQRVLAIADPEWQSLIKLGLYTGQRLGDLALLRWENVDLVAGRMRLFTRKTRQEIKLPIAGPLQDHLLAVPNSDNPKTPLHPRACRLVESQNGRVVSLSNQFIDLLAEAGLRPPKTHERMYQGRSGPRNLSRLSFHSLRHTAVNLLKNSGVPHAIAQALVGHESEAVSQNYTHVGDESLAQALQKFPTL